MTKPSKKSKEEAKQRLKELSKIPLTGNNDKEGYPEVDYKKQMDNNRESDSIRKFLGEE